MKQLSIALERLRIVSAALGRFLIIGASSFGLATATNWYQHQGYWRGTIVRVQTTDFNLLFQMLPTKLSYALLRRDTTELQRTLDSNYGLFGLVVTDCTNETKNCPGQHILYITTSKQSWRENLQVDHLAKYSYDYLRNPLPLVAEGKFDNARDSSRDPTGRINSGQIIGRVYYVRGIPPLFQTAYLSWLQKLPSSLLSDRGAEGYYSLSLTFFSLGGLAGWGFIEWLFYRKRLQNRLAQQKQTQLRREGQRLQQQLQRKDFLLTELEQYRRQEAHQVQIYERKIAHYESQLLQNQTDESLKRLQAALQSTRQQANGAVARIQTLDQSIVAITEERDLAVQKTQQLEQELETAQTQVASLATLAIELELKEVEFRQLQHQIQELEEFQTYALQENEQLNQQNQSLTQAMAQLERKRDALQSELPNGKKQPNTIDLSGLSLALVGGQPRIRRGVFEDLSKCYGLPKNQYVEVPSFKEKSIHKNTLKERIDDCDLVAVVIDYVGHDLKDIVSGLERSRALSGQIVWVEGGKARIVNSILEAFQQLNNSD